MYYFFQTVSCKIYFEYFIDFNEDVMLVNSILRFIYKFDFLRIDLELKLYMKSVFSYIHP